LALALAVLAVLSVLLLWQAWQTERHATVKRVAWTPSIPLDFGLTQPVPSALSLNPGKVTLGNRLFHDVRLSSDDTISCASCHDLSAGGGDNRQRSVGVNGGVGAVNAPTVLNSGFNSVQFWDGRAATLEEQIEGPVHHPLEMASNWEQVLGKLRRDQDLVKSFSSLYQDGMTPANIKDAIATFERSLSTPDSAFDRFLRGDSAALDAEAQRGWQMFQSYGCVSCHQGVNLGGNFYERMGLMGDYFGDRGHPTEADNGRFNVTHDPEDMHYFRVPPLRNVAFTYPYFHDGSAENLHDAVRVMARYQLGRPMPDEDVEAIVAFLRSLTGRSLLEGQP
jgi:cytochrome c peroxidase